MPRTSTSVRCAPHTVINMKELLHFSGLQLETSADPKQLLQRKKFAYTLWFFSQCFHTKGFGERSYLRDIKVIVHELIQNDFQGYIFVGDL